MGKVIVDKQELFEFGVKPQEFSGIHFVSCVNRRGARGGPKLTGLKIMGCGSLGKGVKIILPGEKIPAKEAESDNSLKGLRLDPTNWIVLEDQRGKFRRVQCFLNGQRINNSITVEILRGSTVNFSWEIAGESLDLYMSILSD